MLLLFGLGLLAGCGDGDIRKGCAAYCECHAGKAGRSACEDRCRDRLRAMRKQDRAKERQVADCLAARGQRSCPELALCAGDFLR
jgi:hypothetical protein